MEEIIKKLVALATEYAEFMERKPTNREVVFWYSEDYSEKISAYFTEGKEYVVTFGKVHIAEYKSTIEFPFSYTIEDLEKEYDRAKLFFKEEKERVKRKIQEAKEIEIECLKKQLEELEKS
jgi:hypothetical protein